MWQAKVIKNEAEHEAALASLMKLMEIEHEQGTLESEQLELLGVLIDQYESEHFPIDLPDPVDAIKFRMEQQGLRNKDLVPFIGSAGKVSEVLNRKRPLSLPMIRRLHKDLGIPAGVLIGAANAEIPENSEIDFQQFPLNQMLNNGYFPNFKGTIAKLKEHAEEQVNMFFNSVKTSVSPLVLCRTSAHQRSSKQMNQLALTAWQTRVLHRAQQQPLENRYKKNSVTLEFMQQLVRQSWSDKGPLLAQEYLAKHGIYLIIEPHLDKTYLDGAVMLNYDGNPVIGMTLRHDRLDNFWFTLMHELSHVALHLTEELTCFFDDLDPNNSLDDMENQADTMALEALIPINIWESSNVSCNSPKSEIKNLADKLSIHPAIVAGRIRSLSKNYTIFKALLGQGEVRKLYTA